LPVNEPFTLAYALWDACDKFLLNYQDKAFKNTMCNEVFSCARFVHSDEVFWSLELGFEYMALLHRAFALRIGVVVIIDSKRQVIKR